MRRSRYREDRSGRNLTVAIAAVLAGLALGALISHRLGGLEGIKSRVKKRFRRGGLDLERLREFADEAFADEDDLGEERYESWEDDGATALEAKVLAAFLADETFRERPVDISARDSEIVELTGWVRTKAERMRATAVARKVPGVVTVVNELMVGDPETIDSEELHTKRE
jgi:hypothetical protein